MPDSMAFYRRSAASGIFGPIAIVALVFSACGDPTQPASERPAHELGLAAEPAAVLATTGNVVPGRYIVRLDDAVSNVEPVARSMIQATSGTLRHVYQHAIKGFSATLSPEAIEAIRHDPRVVYVEPVITGRLSGELISDSTTAWGLDRIDQRSPDLDDIYSYNEAGAGITIYVIDSGIRYSHEDFGGRAVLGKDFVGGDGSDTDGHGTHVAGVAGGTTWGVAKGATLVSTADVISNVGSGSPNLLLYSLVPLQAYIAGPTWLDSEGLYEWEAMPSNGDGVYSYQWSVTWFNSGINETLGTGKTQALYVTESDGSFKIRVTVSSGGESYHDGLDVYNNIASGDCGSNVLKC